jgi:hypothetical protein
MFVMETGCVLFVVQTEILSIVLMDLGHRRVNTLPVLRVTSGSHDYTVDFKNPG